MAEIKVQFEAGNFDSTVNYIRNHNLGGFQGSSTVTVEDYLRSEIKKLFESELKRWGAKDYSFFENVCHHPIQGVACLYIIGDDPLEPKHVFEVNAYNKKFMGDVVACLYVFL